MNEFIHTAPHDKTLSVENRGMKTMIICTDFSQPALHAAKYGCQFARQYGFKSIILYHAFSVFVPIAAMPVSSAYAYGKDELAESSNTQLQQLQRVLSDITGDDISIRIKAEDLTLGESINNICQREKADLVVMGISGKSGFEKAFIGSNAVSVAQNSQYPVLIVPAQVPLEPPIRSVLLACDLSEIKSTTPLDLLEKVLKLLQVPLYILNINDKKHGFSPQTISEIYQLHHLFDKYKPHYAFTDDDKDIVAGITNYAMDNKISMIITIPRNYNFLQQLFHSSTTKKLIYQSPVPLLTLHE